MKSLLDSPQSVGDNEGQFVNLEPSGCTSEPYHPKQSKIKDMNPFQMLKSLLDSPHLVVDTEGQSESPQDDYLLVWKLFKKSNLDDAMCSETAPQAVMEGRARRRKILDCLPSTAASRV